MLPKPSTCKLCPLYGSGHGFVPASGTGDNGVLIVLEAAGEAEELAGMPVVGPAGRYLFKVFKKMGLNREGFRIHNCLSCRPPQNKLAKTPYEQAAIMACSPNLTATIEAHKAACVGFGKTPVILALGEIAFMRIMDIDRHHQMLAGDYHSYVHWSAKHQIWVIAGYHPSFLMRGQHQYDPTVQYAVARALEVANEGFSYDEPHLILDPPVSVFATWVEGYLAALRANPEGVRLSVDIETPKKAKKGEEQLIREDDEDYIILRCSFAYKEDEAVSIPWQAEYMPAVQALLGADGNKLVGWNLAYDIPRLKHQMEVNGTPYDGMLWWHVLNSALPKGLGFVTPFYWKRARMWKHLSSREPAYYNAIDALAALININRIEQDLHRAGQWQVVERHIILLNRILERMSRKGVLRDEALRDQAEQELTTLLNSLEADIQVCIPLAAKKLKVYKKSPKQVEGLLLVEQQQPVKVCSACGFLAPTAVHFKSVGKKKLAKGEPENPCVGASKVVETRTVACFAKVEPWKVSNKGLQAYQQAMKHRPVLKDKKPTYDEDAIKALQIRYPQDPLYPKLTFYGKVKKLRGTYIGIRLPDGRIKGGLRVGKDGAIHAEFTHNPSTLRLACQNPNMQNLPRPSGRDQELSDVVRNLVVARDGFLFLERDYSAIEAVLSAYFAQWKDGIRLAKLGIHAYLASHVLGRPADLSWSDADLKAYFAEIKHSNDPAVKQVYNGSKRAVHLSNYGGTPKKMLQAEPETFRTLENAATLQGMYFEVAAPIRQWQQQTQLEAHQNGYLRNPFGYIHRFTHVFSFEKQGGEFVRKLGNQANEVLAFQPQSTAAAIIKEAMIRLADLPVGNDLRLQIHDALVLETAEASLEASDEVLRVEMERPILELPLPPEWDMGEHLVIRTDRKVGKRLGELH